MLRRLCENAFWEFLFIHKLNIVIIFSFSLKTMYCLWHAFYSPLIAFHSQVRNYCCCDLVRLIFLLEIGKINYGAVLLLAFFISSILSWSAFQVALVPVSPNQLMFSWETAVLRWISSETNDALSNEWNDRTFFHLLSHLSYVVCPFQFPHNFHLLSTDNGKCSVLVPSELKANSFKSSTIRVHLNMK